MPEKYFGKYRGRAINNLDPMQLGRLQVSVPSVLGDGRLSWAMPCAPYAGPGVGFFALPPIGANLWVEFEGGDPDYPIWSGCFWGKGELPAQPANPEVKVIKTEQITFQMRDLPGAADVILETMAGMRVAISAEGIELDNGQGSSIKMNGPKVTINQGALEVT